MRLATIDVGTNTALLLISEWTPEGLRVVHQAGGYVRLGEGLGTSGRVSDAAMGRLRGVLQAHREAARSWRAEHIIVTGTSASRDAENRDEIRKMVLEETGADYQVLSGEEEANVTFEGALAGWLDGRTYDGPVTVVDVGGGSTELAQGMWHKGKAERTSAVSLNIGTVRLTENFFTAQPAQAHEVHQCRAWIAGMMDAALGDFLKCVPLVGASGTAHVLFHLHRTHREASGNMKWVDLDYWATELLIKTKEDIHALAPSRMAGRADVFPAGVMVLKEAFRSLDASEFHISEYGVRHGMALRYFRELQIG